MKLATYLSDSGARSALVVDDHLIDLNTGQVIEIVDAEIEDLQDRIAAKLGYELRGHRLELYGVPLKSKD